MLNDALLETASLGNCGAYNNNFLSECNVLRGMA